MKSSCTKPESRVCQAGNIQKHIYKEQQMLHMNTGDYSPTFGGRRDGTREAANSRPCTVTAIEILPFKRSIVPTTLWFILIQIVHFIRGYGTSPPRLGHYQVPLPSVHVKCGMLAIGQSSVVMERPLCTTTINSRWHVRTSRDNHLRIHCVASQISLPLMATFKKDISMRLVCSAIISSST